MVSAGDTLVGDVKKIGRFGAVRWGFAGQSCRQSSWESWVSGDRANDPPGFASEDGGTGFFIEGEKVRQWEGHGWVDYDGFDGCRAWGSGRECALAAMLAGASAERAVEIATRLDPWTGGGIDVLGDDE